MRKIYLICLQQPDSEAIHAIGAKWHRHYVLSESQILVAGPNNGGKSMYDRVKDVLGADFIALIVRINSGTFQGRYNTDLWEWLERHVGS